MNPNDIGPPGAKSASTGKPFLVPKQELILPPGEDRALVLPPGAEPPEVDEVDEEPVVVIGVCHGKRANAKGIVYPCGRRTQLWLPARLCHRCLMDAMRERMENAEVERAVLEELERLDAEDDDDA